MRVEVRQSFDDYVKQAHESAQEILTANGAAIRGLRHFHDFVGSAVWADGADLPPLSSMLTMNAHMLFLSGAHAAMQGHAAAVFPLLRTALENACYAFLIARKPDLQAIWLNRHDNEAARRASRAVFTPAVRETAAAINALQPESGNIVLECYDSAIDSGAHPNPKGLFHHLSISDTRTDGSFAVSLTALHATDAFETQRALIACLDFAFAIALLMSRLRPELTEALATSLSRMNDMKDEAIREFGLSDRREV